MTIHDDLLTAIDCSIRAGDAIMDIYGRDFEIEFKADSSPLTAADKASHRIIEEALQSTPHPVLSEESREISYDERKDWDRYWLVDPLDGTKEFIKKNGEFTVNIALISDGVPVEGIVYVPVEGTLYIGTSEGAFKATHCTGRTVAEILASASPCRVSGSVSSPLRVVASKSHCNDETRGFISALESGYGEVEQVSRGSSLKLCMIAEGAADIYPRIAPTMEWDTAAAHAVVVAAGGAVYKFDEKLAVSAYMHADVTASGAPTPLHYNKENLLNPYFVVSGIHE